MKTKDAYNGSRRTGERFLRLWSELAQGVFPFIMEEVGELDYDHRLFVSVCEAVIDPEEFEYAKWCGNGHPKADRVSIFKAYILKMTLNLKGDKELVELLRQQPLSRRMCGWGSAGLVPIIDFNARRSPEERRMSELEKEIYKDRSAAERVFSHLLDAHGGRNVRVRAPKKIAVHLLLGIIVISVEQTIRMLC